MSYLRAMWEPSLEAPVPRNASTPATKLTPFHTSTEYPARLPLLNSAVETLICGDPTASYMINGIGVTGVFSRHMSKREFGGLLFRLLPQEKS